MKVVSSFLFLMPLAPAAFGASVKSDYQKDFDFGQLRTFTFRTERASNDPLATNDIQAERIQNALAAQLSANGFTQTADNPDFIVAFYSRKEANKAARDLVKRYLKDTKKAANRN